MLLFRRSRGPFHLDIEACARHSSGVQALRDTIHWNEHGVFELAAFIHLNVWFQSVMHSQSTCPNVGYRTHHAVSSITTASARSIQRGLTERGPECGSYYNSVHSWVRPGVISSSSMLFARFVSVAKDRLVVQEGCRNSALSRESVDTKDAFSASRATFQRFLKGGSPDPDPRKVRFLPKAKQLTRFKGTMSWITL